MRINKTLFPVLLSTLLLSVASCKKDDHTVTNPDDNQDVELITTLQVILNDSTGTIPTDTFTFRDLDGPGGQEPQVFDSIALKQSQTYFCSIRVLNESVSPSEDITQEIQDEAQDHLFCFNHPNGNMKVVLTDSDGNYPIGLQSTWYTYAADHSSIQISLKHQPGIKDGTCSPGETDIEIQFPLRIE